MCKSNHLLRSILAGGLALGLGGGAANASTLDGLFSPGELLLTDESGENVIDPATGGIKTGDIAIGDLLIGAAEIDSIANGGTQDPGLDAGREFTSLFQIRVADMADTGTDATVDATTYDIYDFEFEPAGASSWDPYLTDAEAAALGIDRDRMVAIFYDDALEADGGTNFDRAGSDATQELADASDGQRRAVAGLDTEDDFWVAQGPLNLQAFVDAGLNDDLGDFFFGASWLWEDFTSVNFIDFAQNTGTTDLQDIAFAPAPGTVNVGLFGDGDLIGKTADSGFGVFNKVDINVNAVPAPAPLGLMGLGLAGLALFRRRPLRPAV